MVGERKQPGDDGLELRGEAQAAQRKSTQPRSGASLPKQDAFFSGSFDWLKRLRPWVKQDNSWAKVKPRPFSMIDAETYIDERFNPMIKWYDAKAGWAKRRYLRVQATTVVGGAVVPVLVNITGGDWETWIRGGTTAISILVVILVALEGVLHYREQWVNYRSTEQFMRKEYYRFITQQGPYGQHAGEGDGVDRALKLFVERVEQALASENSSTLQILTSTSDASTKETKAGETAPAAAAPGKKAPPAGETAEA